MKKVFFVFSFCTVLGIIRTSAQVDTSTIQKLLQYIMQPIDKTQIPTGFLEEYGCPMLSPKAFNGILSDSNRIDINLWRTLYFQTQTAWVNSASTNPLPDIRSVNSSMNQIVGYNNQVAVPLLIVDYNTVSPDAFNNYLLTYNSATRQVSDVGGRTSSPYQTNHLFAACPRIGQSSSGSETFVISDNLIYNNTGKEITNIQIDFDNGQGFQNCTIGSQISVQYSSEGSKKWIIQVTLDDNTSLQCYAGYYVASPALSASKFSLPDEYWQVPRTSTHNKATVFVCYSNKNRTGTIRKPLIIIDGFNVNHIAPSLQKRATVQSFIDGLKEPGKEGFDFNEHLDDTAGYDLIYIDFEDGADDIVSNAAIVAEVIRRVNNAKVLDDRAPLTSPIMQQNVVMGLSMGGLCARYALAQMTKNNENTQTRLLITHDSPHKGANVPLGLQYLIRMMGGFQLFGYDVYDIYPDYRDAVKLLDAPAAKQMLLYRSNSTNSFDDNIFLNGAYRQMITFSKNDPQPTYRFIATANGSECGHPIFSPGATFVNAGAGISAGADANFLFFKIPIVSYKLAAEIEAYALPPTGNTNKIARLYTVNQFQLLGFINIFKQLYDNTAYAPGNHLPVDGVPGSYTPLLENPALKQLTTLPTFAANIHIPFPIERLLTGFFDVYAYNAGVSYKFTFVAAASALDAGPYTPAIFSQSFTNGLNRSFPSTSSTFIAQETNNDPNITNNAHLQFTARNARWIYNEMENLPNLENCSNECPVQDLYTIEGDAVVCAASNFTVTNPPRGATITWSSDGTVSFDCINCITTTLRNPSDGPANIFANLSYGCGGSPSLSKKVILGKPFDGPRLPFGQSFYVKDNKVNYTSMLYTSNPDYSANYHWKINGAVVNNTNGPNLTLIMPYCTIDQRWQDYTITVSSSNVCGTTLEDCSSYRLDCKKRKLFSTGSCALWYARSAPTRFVLSQDPAKASDLVVAVATISDDEFSKLFFEKANLAAELVQRVEVFNLEGELVQAAENINDKAFNLDFSNLSEGSYNIIVWGNEDYREQQTFKYVIVRSEVEMAEDIANGDVPIFAPDANDRLEVLRQQLFKELKSRDDLKNNSAVLKDFFLQKETENYGTISKINEVLAGFDFSKAQDLLNDWQPHSKQDSNCYAYYDYFIRYLGSQTFDYTDLMGLYELSWQCPLTNGEIIYAARSLYKYISGDPESFENACSDYQSRKAKKLVFAKRNDKRRPLTTESLASETTEIYPNPNNGVFKIKFGANEKGSHVVRILNGTGGTVWEKNANGDQQELEVQKPLGKGIYLVNIRNSETGKTESRKIIVR